VPLADLIPRIPLDGRRPLAANRAELERLYVARVDAYRMAHIRITASRTSAAAVAERILDTLHQLPPFFERSVTTD
jgi:shikimate kinase